MATLKTKFMVGIFVIIGISMAAVAVIWLGLSNYMEKGRYYVAYFDESVQGLDKDSPVKYRGVTIGSVNSIGVAPDADLIQVILKIESEIQLDESIVAQLKSVGITGIMFVELERKDADATAPTQEIGFPTPYPVIGTRPSDIKQFFDAVTEVMVAFNRLDIQGISDQMQSTLAKIEKAVDDAQIDALVFDLQATLAEIQTIAIEKKWESAFNSLDQAANAFQLFANTGTQAVSAIGPTINRIDNVMKENESALKELITDVTQLVLHINALVSKGNHFLEDTHKDTARLMPQLKNTLRQYEKSGKHLNRFLEQIAEQPSRLILGRPVDQGDK